MGYSKTPDIKLDIPIAVGANIVCWIDSKACFGDDSINSKNMDQFRSYVNRFGGGMVIYWFDFLENLAGSDPSILFVNDFPTDLKMLSTGSN